MKTFKKKLQKIRDLENKTCSCGRKATHYKYGPCCDSCEKIERKMLFKSGLRILRSNITNADYKYLETFKTLGIKYASF